MYKEAAENFLQELYDTEKNKGEQYALDLVYKHINNAIRNNEYDLVDEILNTVDVKAVSLSVAFAFLATTKCEQNILSNRKKVSDVLLTIETDNKTQKYLNKLIEN